jgi:hypothetical protein
MASGQAFYRSFGLVASSHCLLVLAPLEELVARWAASIIRIPIDGVRAPHRWSYDSPKTVFRRSSSSTMVPLPFATSFFSFCTCILLGYGDMFPGSNGPGFAFLSPSAESESPHRTEELSMLTNKSNLMPQTPQEKLDTSQREERGSEDVVERKVVPVAEDRNEAQEFDGLGIA